MRRPADLRQIFKRVFAVTVPGFKCFPRILRPARVAREARPLGPVPLRERVPPNHPEFVIGLHRKRRDGSDCCKASALLLFDAAHGLLRSSMACRCARIAARSSDAGGSMPAALKSSIAFLSAA